MFEMGYNSSDLGDLEKSMWKTANDLYPKEAKAFLRKEGNTGRKILRSEIKSSTKKKTGNLLKGIKRGKVWNNHGSWQVRVYDTAPHTHLLQGGHRIFAPSKGSKVKKGPSGTMLRAKYVDTGRRTSGKGFFDAAEKRFESQVVRDLDGFLDDLLERGFDL